MTSTPLRKITLLCLATASLALAACGQPRHAASTSPPAQARSDLPPLGTVDDVDKR
jgi:uncharacterized lipoprotein YajG